MCLSGIMKLNEAEKTTNDAYYSSSYAWSSIHVSIIVPVYITPTLSTMGDLYNLTV